ncbi:hypothetical protein ACS0TY_002134 [Phlomoides rotata]
MQNLGRLGSHTPCLPKVPRGRARRHIATTWERIPHRQGDRRRGSQGASSTAPPGLSQSNKGPKEKRTYGREWKKQKRTLSR